MDNLAGQPAYRRILNDLSQRLEAWLMDHGIE
jgi:hypothetical protein